MPSQAQTQADQPQHGLTGSYRVRVIRPALREAARLCPRARDYFELRAQALKLRYWPQHEVLQSGGNLLDLDWEWIKALSGKEVGELRVEDEIGGFNNLRVIFYVGDVKVKAPLPMIWILAILQKKRQDFTVNNIDTFDGRRKLVIERFYNHREWL